MSDSLTIFRSLTPADWPAVRAIYAEGIATGDATFEQEPPSWEAWDRSHLAACRLVAEQAGRVVGWAALSGVSDRCVYGGVAEVSVYVAAAARGQGVGRALLQALVDVVLQAFQEDVGGIPFASRPDHGCIVQPFDAGSAHALQHLLKNVGLAEKNGWTATQQILAMIALELLQCLVDACDFASRIEQANPLGCVVNDKFQ